MDAQILGLLAGQLVVDSPKNSERIKISPHCRTAAVASSAILHILMGKNVTLLLLYDPSGRQSDESQQLQTYCCPLARDLGIFASGLAKMMHKTRLCGPDLSMTAPLTDESIWLLQLISYVLRFDTEVVGVFWATRRSAFC